MLFRCSSSKEGKFRESTTNLRGGFSLIELIVVLAIFLVITAIVLVGQSKFRGSILLGNLAYDVALSVRQAQSFGLGVRGFGTGSDAFNVAYGIHFDSGSSYVLFADANRNGKYDPLPSPPDVPELVQLFTLQSSYTISSFCGVLPIGGEECGLTFLDIVFDRPEPDALFLSNTGQSYSSARITVRSPHGEERNVVISVTGQISVEQPPPQ